MKNVASIAAAFAMIVSSAGFAAAAPSDAEIQKAAAQCFGMVPANWTTMTLSCTTIIELPQASAGNKAKAHYNRGSANLRLGNAKAAYDDFTAAIGLKPKFPMALVARGELLTGEGKYDLAIADFDKAIDANAKVAAAYSGRGLAFVYKKDLTRAFADLDKAISLEPSDAEGYASRGTAYQLSGDNTKALADLNKAVQMNPRSVTALFNRGKVYVSMKDTANAKADFNAVLALDPGNQLAKDQLQALGGV